MGGVNLIPLAVRRRRLEQRRARRAVLCVGGYLAVLLTGTLMYSMLVTPTLEDPAATQRRLASAEEESALLDRQIESTGRRLLETTRRVEAARVLSQRPKWTTMLQLIGDAAGPNVVLGDLRLKTGGSTSDQLTVDLTGLATGPATVSSFALRLEAIGLFDQVSLGSSKREPYGSDVATAFSLRCVYDETGRPAMQAVAQGADR